MRVAANTHDQCDNRTIDPAVNASGQQTRNHRVTRRTARARQKVHRKQTFAKYDGKTATARG